VEEMEVADILLVQVLNVQSLDYDLVLILNLMEVLLTLNLLLLPLMWLMMKKVDDGNVMTKIA
jgi:hypothetical protein